MSSVADRIEFGPPRDAGSPRAFALALFAHALLIAALTWGVRWQSTDKAVSFEAELWSAVPQQAAPKLIEAPPPPPPPPARPEPQVTPPPAPKVDIALEQEKKRKLQQQQKQAEELAKKEKERDKERKLKEDLAKKKATDEARLAEAKKEDAKQREKQKLAEAAEKKQRDDAMNRMRALAGASGSEDAKGSAQQSSGPSASYGGKVRARVLPNVVFTDDIAGNPKAEVEVRTTPDGTILSQRLVTSSGNKAWDEAVMKAIIRTGSLPRDIDGRVPTPMILEFRPRD